MEDGRGREDATRQEHFCAECGCVFSFDSEGLIRADSGAKYTCTESLSRAYSAGALTLWRPGFIDRTRGGRSGLCADTLHGGGKGNRPRVCGNSRQNSLRVLGFAFFDRFVEPSRAISLSRFCINNFRRFFSPTSPAWRPNSAVMRSIFDWLTSG